VAADLTLDTPNAEAVIAEFRAGAERDGCFTVRPETIFSQEAAAAASPTAE
jgi:hypothetical protein